MGSGSGFTVCVEYNQAQGSSSVLKCVAAQVCCAQIWRQARNESPPRHHLPILLLVRPEAAEVPVSAKTLIVMIGSYPDCHTRTRVTCHVSSVDMHGQIGTLLAEINKDIVLIQHNDNIQPCLILHTPFDVINRQILISIITSFKPSAYNAHTFATLKLNLKRNFCLLLMTYLEEWNMERRFSFGLICL